MGLKHEAGAALLLTAASEFFCMIQIQSFGQHHVFALWRSGQMPSMDTSQKAGAHDVDGAMRWVPGLFLFWQKISLGWKLQQPKQGQGQEGLCSCHGCLPFCRFHDLPNFPSLQDGGKDGGKHNDDNMGGLHQLPCSVFLSERALMPSNEPGGKGGKDSAREMTQ